MAGKLGKGKFGELNLFEHLTKESLIIIIVITNLDGFWLMDNLPNFPNFPLVNLSCYTVTIYNYCYEHFPYVSYCL